MAPKQYPLPPEIASLSGEVEVSLIQLAQLLGVTYQTARRYANRGYIVGIQRGGSWVFKASEVRRFLESGNSGANDSATGKAADHYKNTRKTDANGYPPGFKVTDLDR